MYDDMLDRLQRNAFAYFVTELNPANGLVKDCTRPGFRSNIAPVGLAQPRPKTFWQPLHSALHLEGR